MAPKVEPLALRVIEAVNDAAEEVVRELRELAASPAQGGPSAEVSLEAPAGAEDPAVLRYAGDEIRVSALHFRKLRALYELHGPPPEKGPGREAYESTFRKRLYLLLRRYITFIGLDPSDKDASGGNMHAAAPETVFSWLKEELGVGCEVFASPLNCYFSTYFSAFPDVDAPFGSRGSFFDVGLLPEGSYEVGPPYTEEVMELTARKLLAQLQHPEAGALSFVLFVPDWAGAGALELLDGPSFSAFRQSRHGGPFALAKGRDHHYVTGAQFFVDKGADTTRRYYTVPHGTRVYVLQNAAGAERWPFTQDSERALLDRLRSPSSGAPHAPST